MTLTFLEAPAEGVTGQAVGTSAHGVMSDHRTLSIDATGTQARINALVVDAGERHGTIRVDGALRTAGRSEVPGQTGADGLGVVRTWSTHRIGTTRVGLAWGQDWRQGWRKGTQIIC